MNDRELLEAAAKAEGHAYPWVLPAGFGERPWNPLTDDGDALRLAVKLRLLVNVTEFFSIATDGADLDGEELHGSDPYAATRRAIVRATASEQRKNQRTRSELRAAAAIGGATGAGGE